MGTAGHHNYKTTKLGREPQRKPDTMHKGTLLYRVDFETGIMETHTFVCVNPPATGGSLQTWSIRKRGTPSVYLVPENARGYHLTESAAWEAYLETLESSRKYCEELIARTQGELRVVKLKIIETNKRLGRRVTEFKISLPSDLVKHEGMTDAEILEELGEYAINQARDEAKDYVIPARWEAQHVAGDLKKSWEIEFIVKRISNV